MYKVTAIIPSGQGMGFSLAGVQVLEVSGIDDAHSALAAEMKNRDNGLILIDEAFNRDFPAKLQKMVDEMAVPLVVSIPVITRWEQIHERDEIVSNIIRRAVGYRIKLGE